jgi:hypothetical protein
MRYFNLEPKKCDPFKAKMAESGWEITFQDVGQTEILAYGYVIVWETADKKVTMNYEDRQGQERANLEVSINAAAEVQEMVDSL